MSSRVAARRDRRGPAVLPHPGQPAPGQGLVPAVHAPVRRQLGIGDLGLQPRRGGQTGPCDPQRAATRSTSSSRPATSRRGPRSRCRRPSRGAPCTARPAACSRCCSPTCPTSTPARFARPSSLTNSIIGFNFGDGHLHNERNGPRRAGRGPVRTGRVRHRMGRVGSRSAAGCSTTSSSTPPSAWSRPAPGRSPTPSPSSRGCPTAPSRPG